eukprot:CAMPEP_0117535374 /NCGR_PEP_ID=MMETSP0784-20121206/40902_1 /TAXON_ID=39447 /ORGANISM="" /LENGTH=661 /DNA_ID=CAMNT_0005331899 /DNA_START=6 /DNA_END=1991 /DNA_ORIENTATION=+
MPSPAHAMEDVVETVGEEDMGAKEVENSDVETKSDAATAIGDDREEGDDELIVKRIAPWPRHADSPSQRTSPVKAADASPSVASTAGSVSAFTPKRRRSSLAFFPFGMPEDMPEDLVNKPLIKRLIELTRPNFTLEEIAKECFNKAAAGQRRLNLAGFRTFRSHLAGAVDVPEDAFGNLSDEYTRFDFGGDGLLEEPDCYRFAKYHLRGYLKRLGPDMFETPVPHKTLVNAGYQVTENIELGHGTFGVLKLARNRSGKQCCIKCIAKWKLNLHGPDELKEEFDAMHHLSNERIAKTFELFQDEQSYYLVTEPYFGGDFEKLAQRAAEHDVQMTEEWWRFVFKQCFEGLAFLHKHAMMHCDIKEANLMLKTPNFHRPDVVIIDYGLAHAMTSTREYLCGTPGYIPPETWDRNIWFPKGDCFSMGVCVLQLLTDRVPIATRTGTYLRPPIFAEGAMSYPDVERTTALVRPPLHLMPQQYPMMVELVKQLLEKDQAHRPNAARVLRHPWFVTPTLRGPPFDPRKKPQNLSKPAPDPKIGQLHVQGFNNALPGACIGHTGIVRYPAAAPGVPAMHVGHPRAVGGYFAAPVGEAQPTRIARFTRHASQQSFGRVGVATTPQGIAPVQSPWIHTPALAHVYQNGYQKASAPHPSTVQHGVRMLPACT